MKFNYGHTFIILASMFVLNWSNKTTPTKFYCYHGESDDTKLIKIDCPNEICIMYVTPCQNYWATTCYDPSDPLGITKAFEKVPKLKQTSYSICRKWSGCNKDPIETILNPADPYSPYKNGLYVETIKPPKSFDNLLWPMLGKEKRNNKNFLENEFTLRKKLLKAKNGTFYYPINNIYEFLGQTFNSSKKVWVEYEFREKDFNVRKKLRLTFDLIESSVVGCIWNATTPKIYGKLLNLKQKLFPGQIINVSLSSMITEDYVYNFTLWINDEPLNYTTYNFFNYIKYGGKMSAKNTLSSALQFHDFSIAFTQPEPNTPKIHCDEEFMAVFKPNTKLNYTIIDSKQNDTLTIENNLAPNEMIEYEFRDSLCPLTAVSRIQILAFQNNLGVKYYTFYSWDFRNFYWVFDNRIIINSQECSSIVIKPMDERWTSVICKNNNSSVAVEKNMFIILSSTFKYFVKSPIEKFKC